MNKLGKWIKEQRLKSSMNQSDYAEKLGITYVTLSKIENGHKAGINVLRKISHYTGISPKLLKEMMEFELSDSKSN